jgi:hypothetical protein
MPCHGSLSYTSYAPLTLLGMLSTVEHFNQSRLAMCLTSTLLDDAHRISKMLISAF